MSAGWSPPAEGGQLPVGSGLVGARLTGRMDRVEGTMGSRGPGSRPAGLQACMGLRCERRQVAGAERREWRSNTKAIWKTSLRGIKGSGRAAGCLLGQRLPLEAGSMEILAHQAAASALWAWRPCWDWSLWHLRPLRCEVVGALCGHRGA